MQWEERGEPMKRDRGKSQEHAMIDWNVNEIKRRISRREISPLSPLFSASSKGMIKIRGGDTTWTSMDEAPNEESTGPLVPLYPTADR